jgi:hypothetical protein
MELILGGEPNRFALYNPKVMNNMALQRIAFAIAEEQPSQFALSQTMHGNTSTVLAMRPTIHDPCHFLKGK